MSSIYKTIAAGIRSVSLSDDVRQESLRQHGQFNKTEATRISDLIKNQPRVPTATPGTDGVFAYATSVNSAMSKRIDENREILKLMPEVMQMATMHRAAIQAPNDLQLTPINFITEYAPLSETVRKQIQKVITDEIELHLGLSRKLSGIIHRAIFEVGAECIITLPSSKLDEALGAQINERGNTRALTATESVGVVERYNKWLRGHIITNINTDKKDRGDDAMLGMECAKHAIAHAAAVKSEIPNRVAEEIAQCVNPDNLLLVDDVDFIRSGIIQDAVALERLTSALVPKAQYGTEDLSDSYTSSIFSDKSGPSFITSFDGTNTPNSKNIKGEPVILSCPANSIIPIIRSGYPSNHYGYLYLTDIDGMPFSGDSYQSNQDRMSAIGTSKVVIGSSTLSRNERFSKLNQMMTGQGILGRDNNDIVVRAIHKETVKSFLQRKLRDGGLRGISIPERNDVYDYLFANYMAGQTSRIVFLPSQLVTYITLNYNPIDGTGDSALESIKDTLVHLMTLRMARLHASTLNAVNRRTINVNFSQKFRGNHQQVLDEMVRAHIERSNTSSSFNPAVISQDLVRKAVTVKATGIPGMDGFTAEVQPTEGQRSVPDSDLAEDLDKTYKSGLFVPAAATNNLSEAEYSRSVATTNIHYAQVVTDHQVTICNGITHVVRNVLRYSERIRKRILSLLNDEPDNKDGTVSTTRTIINYDEFVDSVHARLPKPNLPANNLKLDIVPQAISNISSIVESLYPDTLYAGADSDTYQTMQTIRAYVTQLAVRRILDDLGTTDSLGGFPTLQEMVLEAGDITDQRMSADSIQTAIAELNKLVVKLKENAGLGSTDSGDVSDGDSGSYSDAGNAPAETPAETDYNQDETGGEADKEQSSEPEDQSGPSIDSTSKDDKPSQDQNNKGDAFDQVDKLEF